ncbi:hypothetical protein BD769DRAFT_1466081 [Suillus cothurnatus]|nr:hypothetical protein BD769DRAFT_1466081 [Suillus cothurnatus]
MEGFSSMWEAISNYIIVPQWALLPTFQVVQQFKRLPDFLMFPISLALVPQDHVTSASPEAPDREIIRAMNAFITFAKEAQKQSQSSSDAVKYAHQNWVVHLSRAPNPWDDALKHIFQAFWNHHLLSWLERQWCLKGLRSCLDILSELQKLAKDITMLQFAPPTHSQMNGCQLSVPIPVTQQPELQLPFPSPRPNTNVGTSRKRTALESDTSDSPSKRRK